MEAQGTKESIQWRMHLALVPYSLACDFLNNSLMFEGHLWLKRSQSRDYEIVFLLIQEDTSSAFDTKHVN